MGNLSKSNHVIIFYWWFNVEPIPKILKAGPPKGDSTAIEKFNFDSNPMLKKLNFFWLFVSYSPVCQTEIHIISLFAQKGSQQISELSPIYHPLYTAINVHGTH